MNRTGSPSCSSRHSQNASVPTRASKISCHVAISAVLPLPDGALSRHICQLSRSSSADVKLSSTTNTSDNTGASNLRCRKRGAPASACVVTVVCMAPPNRRKQRRPFPPFQENVLAVEAQRFRKTRNVRFQCRYAARMRHIAAGVPCAPGPRSCRTCHKRCRQGHDTESSS